MIASAAAHDIYHRTINPRAGISARLWLGRIMILAAAILALYMGVNYTYPELSLFGITHTAAGSFGMAVNFLVI